MNKIKTVIQQLSKSVSSSISKKGKNTVTSESSFSYKKDSGGNTVCVKYSTNSDGKHKFEKKRKDSEGNVIIDYKLENGEASDAITEFKNSEDYKFSNLKFKSLFVKNFFDFGNAGKSDEKFKLGGDNLKLTNELSFNPDVVIEDFEKNIESSFEKLFLANTLMLENLFDNTSKNLLKDTFKRSEETKQQTEQTESE